MMDELLPGLEKVPIESPPIKKSLHNSSAFDWTGKAPELEPHSEAKLRVLREYLVDYITIWCNALPQGVPTFQLYLIDGFSGGGEYDGGKLGSPLVLLQAIKEADFRVNKDRKSKIQIAAKYWFVDESPVAIASLHDVLQAHDYSGLIGESVFIKQAPFTEEYPRICRQLQKLHPQGGARALFFLDQCGYSKVRPQMVKDISSNLPKAEFIVNFSIGWLADFLDDSDGAKKLLESTGLSSELSIDELLKTRLVEGRTSWAWTVESKISRAYQEISGMRYFSPFFIVPEKSHRAYWLLHLASHAKARQAMVSVHWANANGTRHYGKDGLEILTHKPDIDKNRYLEGVGFGSFEKANVLSCLKEELPDKIFKEHKDGVSFGDLLAEVCNQTNADVPAIQQCLAEIYQDGGIAIIGPNGGKKRPGNNSINSKDVIKPKRQIWFKF